MPKNLLRLQPHYEVQYLGAQQLAMRTQFSLHMHFSYLFQFLVYFRFILLWFHRPNKHLQLQCRGGLLPLSFQPKLLHNANYITVGRNAMHETCFTPKHAKFNSFTSSFCFPKRTIHPFALCSHGTLKYLLKRYTFHVPDHQVKLIANHTIQKYNIGITWNVPSCGRVLLKVQFSLFWIFPSKILFLIYLRMNDRSGKLFLSSHPHGGREIRNWPQALAFESCLQI